MVPNMDVEFNLSATLANITELDQSVLDQPSSLKVHSIITIVVCSLILFANSICCLVIALVFSSSRTVNGSTPMNGRLRFVVSLCAADMLLSVMSLMQIYETFTLNECTSITLRSMCLSAHVISLLNLVGLATDHYMAIIRPLYHQCNISSLRTNLAIVSCWVGGLLCGFSNHFIPASYYAYCSPPVPTSVPISFVEKLSIHCYNVACSRYDPEYLLYVIVFLVAFLMSFLYLRIYARLRRLNNFQRAQTAHNDRRTNRQSLNRNMRGLITTVLLLVTFLICWLPSHVFKICMHIFMDRLSFEYIILMSKYVEAILDILILTSSVLNPLIYALRMKDVRRGYVRGAQMICPCLLQEELQNSSGSRRRYLNSTLSTTSSSGHFSNGSIRSVSHRMKNSRWSTSSSNGGHPRPSSTSTMAHSELLRTAVGHAQ